MWSDADPPRRLTADAAELAEVLALIRVAFADMDGRIDPPSSVHRLSVAALADQCRSGELWVIGAPPLATMSLSRRADCLYLGKLAVAAPARGRGLARRLVAVAADRARAQGLPALELQTRVELVENHAAFARMGFVRTGETAHAGFDRPTTITLRRRV